MLDQPDDTEAEFESTWREFGVSLPANVEEYRLTEEAVETAEGDVKTTQVNARGPSNSQSRSAVRSKKPKKALTEARELENKANLGYSATYVERTPNSITKRAFGKPKIISQRRDIQVTGGGKRKIIRPIPGSTPFQQLAPQQGVTVRETVTVRARGVLSANDMPMPKPLFPAHLETDSTQGLPRIVERHLDDHAHVWQATAQRTYQFASTVEIQNLYADAIKFNLKAPGYSAVLDSIQAQLASHV